MINPTINAALLADAQIEVVLLPLKNYVGETLQVYSHGAIFTD